MRVNVTVVMRTFLIGLGVAVLVGAAFLLPQSGAARVAVTDKDPKTYPVHHTDAEWRKLLSPEAYGVLRHADTEEAFTGSLLNEHRKGTFVCAGCGNELFSSDTKFDSGTGWPSFYKAIRKGAVIEREDDSLGEPRTEVICAKCGGHLGHVFDDGPKPTGLRYCMNSVAMKFVPKAATK